MNKINMFVIVALGIGILFSNLSNNAIAQSFDPIPKMPKIHEDQIITCVKDVSDNEQTRGSLICHIFNIDDLDWYQEISENNYGQIGSLNDSFEMGLID